MTNILIRECARRDLDQVFELETLWREEGVSYAWYGDRDDLIADFDGFQKYDFVAERDDRIIGYVNGSIRTYQTVGGLPNSRIIWQSKTSV